MTGRDRVLKAVLNQLTGVLDPVGTTESPFAIRVIDSACRYSVNNCPIVVKSEPRWGMIRPLS